MTPDKCGVEYADRFVALCRKWGGVADWQSVFEQLLSNYAEPWRHYHTFRHIAHCLREFDLAAAHIRLRDATEMALWFHDVIYMPGRHDNELQSAERFVELTQHRFPAEFEDQVRSLILITEHVTPPANLAEAYMVDIDLSPFGIPWDECLQDSKRVRLELPRMRDAEYFEANLRFLQTLVKRTHLYRTDYFRDRYERSARENIGRLMEKIESQGKL